MIEKILERLEEYKKNWMDADFLEGVDEIKAIVQEVAKEYGKDTNVRSSEYEKGYEDGYEEGAESVRALAPYDNGWIPCSERLPEPYKKVLVYEEDGEIYMAKYHEDMKRFSHVGSAWCVRGNEVIAWMPLPSAPYQKGE